MLLLIICSIFDTVTSQNEGVCGPCSTTTTYRRRMFPSCSSHDNVVEECVKFGEDYCCYWKNDSIINIGPDITRKCINDADCGRFDYSVYTGGWSNPNSVPHCLRCCANSEIEEYLCTETISTETISCGDPVLNLFGTTAPCCADENCLDNKLGICGDIAEECESCMTWTNFEDSVSIKHNCGQGLFCLTDGHDIEFNEAQSFDLDDDMRRRILLGSIYNEEIVFSNGICVPHDGISETKKECINDNECPLCMRCCSNGDMDGTKQCIRSSGINCGLEFPGRGACCCPQDICKNNQCKTPTSSPSKTPTSSSPSKLPTSTPSKSPTHITPLPTRQPTRDRRRL
eukprot:438897_1